MPRIGSKGKRKKSKFTGLDFKKKEKEVEDVEVLEVSETPDLVPDTSPTFVVEAEQDGIVFDSVEIRKKTLEIKDNINKYYTELCQNLWLIQKKQLYKGWGYPSFREYGSKELEFGGTKAIYLASIWNNLAVNQDKKVFDKVMELGWSKGKELARVVTQETLGEWLDKARHMRVEALVKEIRTFIKKKVPDDTQQALLNEDEVKGTAMEEEKKTITLTFNYEDYLTVSQAFEHIKQEDPDATLPQSLAMCARDYLASNEMTALGKDAAVQIIARLAKIHSFKVLLQTETPAEDLSDAPDAYKHEEHTPAGDKSFEEALFES